MLKIYRLGTELSPTLIEYSNPDEFMGDCSIQATLELDEPFEFAINDYVQHPETGEKFYLDYIPTDKKVSTYSFIYTLKFITNRRELYHCDFVDVLPTGGVTLGTTVEFTGDLSQLKTRIESNLNRLYTFPNNWKVQIGEDPLTPGVEYATDYKEISLTDSKVWDAISLCKSIFNLNFKIDSQTRTIILGYTPVNPFGAFKFQYGKGNGLYEINRISQDDTAIVTRLRAFGGSKNIPADYNRRTTEEYHTQLMLPGYASTGKDYIDSTNTSIYGIREGVYRNEDIYPSIVGLSASDVPASTATGRLDEIVSVSLIAIETQAEFNIWIKDLGFDPNDVLMPGETFTISMTTGKLAGVDFEITKCVVDESVSGAMYKLTCNRNTDDSFSLPDTTINASAGDRFVLLNIGLPQVYIDAAESRLLVKATGELSKVDTTKVVYSVGVDEIFMKKNSTVSSKVESGTLFHVFDAQLGIDKQIIAQRVSVDRGSNPIPTYQVTLSNEPVVGTIGGIKNDISDIEQNVIVNKYASDLISRKNVHNLNRLRDSVFDPDGYFDGQHIKPNSLETLYLAVGAKSWNFILYSDIKPNYLGNPDWISLSSGVIQHREIKWGDVDDSDHYLWSFDGLTLSSPAGALTPESEYYIYVKCSKIAGTAEWDISTAQKIADGVDGNYYFFVGVLYPSVDTVGGDSHSRGDSISYGKTWINGRFITTGVIQSVDQLCKIDLDANFIQFKNSDGSTAFYWNRAGSSKVEIVGGILQRSKAIDEGNNESFITVDRGAYSETEPYFIANLVQQDGSTWYCDTACSPALWSVNSVNFHIYAAKGETGNAGLDSVTGVLTNDSCTLPAASDGEVTDFSAANGLFKMYSGATDVTALSQFSSVATNCEGGIETTGSFWADGVSMGNLDSSTNWQELSGLTAAYKLGNANYLWVLSDSPANQFAAIKKSDASNQGVWSLTGSPSKIDWEDIESSVVGGIPYLYIFDFGNNPNTANSRGAGIDMVIHRVVEPAITGNTGSTSDYISINCAFPTVGAPSLRDCEAAIIDQTTGDIYIITKRESIPGVYKLAHQASYTGIQTLTYMGKMYDIPDATTSALGSTACNVVDATINKSGTEIIVKNYSNLYLFSRNPQTQSIFQALQGTPTIVQGYVGGGSNTPAKSHPSAEPQGEGVCFDELGVNLYSHSEYVSTAGSTPTRFPLFKYSRVNISPTSISFQDGVSGYSGTEDTYIWDTNPDTVYGLDTTFVVDTVDATETGRRKGLLKFDLSSIPSNAIIVGAYVTLNIAVEGQGWIMYRMLVDWDEQSTYNTLGGVIPDGIKAAVTPDCVNGINLDNITGLVKNNVPISTIQGWVDGSFQNYGWMLDGLDVTTGDGVQFTSREDTATSNRPKLTLRYILSDSTPGKYRVTSFNPSTENGYLTLHGIYGGVDITRIFSISKALEGLPGGNGADATVYEISPNSYAINKNTDGIFTPTSAIFTFHKITAGIREAYLGYYKVYYSTNGVDYTLTKTAGNYSAFLTMAASYLAVKCELYTDVLYENMVDSQTVIVVSDGVDGSSVRIVGSAANYASLPMSGNVLWDGRITVDNGHLYTWNGTAWVDCGEIRGPEGIPGTDGADGQSLYTWVKYADTPTSGMNDNPAGKMYIGLAYNKTSSTESTTYSDYAWSKIQGVDGVNAAFSPNRGLWKAGETYYGTSARQDTVKRPSDGYWYKAASTAGIFTDSVWTESHWVSFDYSGESIATDTLLADGANIAGFLFKKNSTNENDGAMVSQGGIINSGGSWIESIDQSNHTWSPKVKVDAVGQIIEVNSLSGESAMGDDGQGGKTTLKLDSSSGGISASNSLRGLSMLSPLGIFSNNAKQRAYSSASGGQVNPASEAAVVGLGFNDGDVDPDENRDSYANPYGVRKFSAGVIGRGANDGSADNFGVFGHADKSSSGLNFGGYFIELFAAGLFLNPKQVGEATYNILPTDVFISVYSVPNQNIYLPSNPQIGQTFLIRRNNNYGVTIRVSGSPQMMLPGGSLVGQTSMSNMGSLYIIHYDGQYWMVNTIN